MTVIRGSFGALVAGTFLLCSPLLAACAPLLAGASAPVAERIATTGQSPLHYVNPLIGTSGGGNVFPGASAPFGMVQWSPDTSAGGLSRPGAYAYGDRIITGFSLTHLSGAGCVAFGNLPIMPTLRPFRAAPQANGSPYSDRYVHTHEHASPGSYDVRLASGIGVRLTATLRTGFGVFSFPRGSSGTVIINTGGASGGRLNTDGALDSSVDVIGRHEVAGWSRSGHFCNLTNSYKLYFDATFDRPFTRVATWRGSSVKVGSRKSAGARAGAALTFSGGGSVKVKIGLSYVSVHNARSNLASENRGWNDTAVRTQTQARWTGMLGRIHASGGSPSEQRVFYTALYHAFLHPNVFSDANGQYVGFDGRVHTGGSRVQYANFSGWDVYRSEVQLLAWLLPHETSDMMQSMVEDARQQGWLPKWPVANAETGEMNGDSADPMLSGAYAFGARNFDSRAALRFMLKGATQPGAGPGGYSERPGLRSYLRLGYIPGYNPIELHPYGAVATTLEYNIDDYAVAQLAKSMGDGGSYRAFIGRSRSWRKLFNPAAGLIEPRLEGGSFPQPFSATSLDGYVEGNALQYTWMVPHDLSALVSRIGGTRRVMTRLDPLFRRLDGGPTDPYDWAGNEPGFTLPWVYDFAGAPWRTQAAVRQIMSNRYTTTVGGLPGNDDLGALSSWYVWAALGLYPEVPGVAGWAVTSPLFPHISVHGEAGNRLDIQARSKGQQSIYIQSLRLDGKPYRRAWLPLSALSKSSALTFSLGEHPNRRWGK
jgi:predicted alpha-1,2-mannosidase